MAKKQRNEDTEIGSNKRMTLSNITNCAYHTDLLKEIKMICEAIYVVRNK